MWGVLDLLNFEQGPRHGARDWAVLPAELGLAHPAVAEGSNRVCFVLVLVSDFKVVDDKETTDDMRERNRREAAWKASNCERVRRFVDLYGHGLDVTHGVPLVLYGIFHYNASNSCDLVKKTFHVSKFCKIISSILNQSLEI